MYRGRLLDLVKMQVMRGDLVDPGLAAPTTWCPMSFWGTVVGCQQLPNKLESWKEEFPYNIPSCNQNGASWHTLLQLNGTHHAKYCQKYKHKSNCRKNSQWWHIDSNTTDGTSRGCSLPLLGSNELICIKIENGSGNAVICAHVEISKIISSEAGFIWEWRSAELDWTVASPTCDWSAKTHQAELGSEYLS